MLAILRRPTILTVAGAIAATVFSEAHCLGAQVVKVFNPSFEMPVVTDPSGIAPAPSAAAQGAGPGDSPWVFSGGSGVVASGATFPLGALSFVVPTPPDGNQWAYLEQATGMASQALTFPAAGQYTVTFDKSGPLSFLAAWIDNSPITLSPGASSSSSFVPVSGSLDVTAGRHTLLFQNTDATARPIGDPPVLIDAVAVAPEPACGLVLGLGLVLIRRR